MNPRAALRIGARWLGVIGACIVSADAAELTYGGEYAAERTSNIRRAPVVEEAETINSIRVHASYRDVVPTFHSNLSVAAEHLDYRRDLFQDETRYLFDGTAVWIPVPYFSWTVADSYRNVPVSRTLPDTPANRENTNVFLTGPGFEWRITPADYLITEARYGRFDAEDLDIDNDRYSFATRWRRRHSSLSDNSINYEHLTVKFDNDVVNTNYSRQDLFYRGRAQRGRNQMVLDLGYTEIHRDGLADVDGSLFRFTAARDISSTRRMGTTLTAEYSDSAFSLAPSGITATTPGSGTSVPTDALTGDVFYTKRGEVFITSAGSSFPWSASAFAANIDYEQGASDVEEAGGQLNLSYVYSPNMTFNVYSNYTKSKYPTLLRTDRDAVNGVSVSWRLRRTLRLALEGQRAERRSSDALQTFTDDRVFLRLIYSVARPWN